MEYTKDLIFDVHYDNVNNPINLKKNKWTSRVIKKIKQHKIITGVVSAAMFLFVIDGILIINFIKLLERL